MERTSIWLQKGDVEYLREQGLTLSGFVRVKILEFRHEKEDLTPAKRKTDKPRIKA